MASDDHNSGTAEDEDTSTGPLDAIADIGKGKVLLTSLPDRIGRYRIRRIIASGGMGTVYEAVQESPRRTVALKVMKHGVGSRSALRRFEYESQILARLRHPGIAQVYEAGMHEDPVAAFRASVMTPSSSSSDSEQSATPYFAMEYIPNAKPITDYAQAKKLSTRQRLELFAQVCEAVYHGHQKGIIYRDLKPSNILVDSHGQVKVIDFGVARATDADLAVTTLQTDVGQLIGTLQYMSPEQCDADPHDIDTRSDVYALGVVLYELLCEQLPYDVTKVALYEAARVIRETAPARPSSFNRTLRGDVETIALKALEKERDRRYRSAADLSEDICRYMRSEPIAARRPSLAYQIATTVRRNKKATIVVTLVVGLVFALGMLSLAWWQVHSVADAAIERSTREYEQRVLMSLHAIDSANRDDYQAVVDRMAAKILNGMASREEICQFTRALAETVSIEIDGGVFQRLEDATVTINVEGSTAVSAHGLGLWFTLRPDLEPADAYAPFHVIVGVKKHGGAFAGKSYSFAIQQPGQQVVRAVGHVRLVRILDGTTIQTGMPSPDDVLSDPVSLPLPRFDFLALEDLPSDYPVAVRSDRFAREFADGVRIEGCKLVAIDGSGTMAELEVALMLTSTEVSLPLGVEVVADGPWANFAVLIERRGHSTSWRFVDGEPRPLRSSLRPAREGYLVEVRIDVPAEAVRRAFYAQKPLSVVLQSSREVAYEVRWHSYLDLDARAYEVWLTVPEHFQDILMP